MTAASPALDANAMPRIWAQPVAMLLPLLLGLYAVLDSWVFYVGNEQRIAYTVITGLSLVLAILGLPRTMAPPRAWALILAWAGICLLPLAPVLTQRTVMANYVVGDLASMVLPLVLFVVMWSMPRMLRPATALAPYAALLGLAAVAAVVSPASYNERHADPVILAFVLGWSYLMFGSGESRGRLAWPFLLLLLFVAFSSGYRSSLAMWFLIGLMVQFLSRGARTAIVSGIALLVAGALYVALTPAEVLQEQLAATRLDTLVGEESDSSLESRGLEVKDVAAAVATDWTPINYVFGAGHGATFKPVYSDPWRNINEHGTVHNIHITPVLLFFRYGLLGLGAFAALAFVTVSSFLHLRRRIRTGHRPLVEVVFTVGMAVYLFDAMRHVVLVDPAFSYTLAGFLRLRFAPHPTA
jgi:hypothetical protein